MDCLNMDANFYIRESMKFLIGSYMNKEYRS